MISVSMARRKDGRIRVNQISIFIALGQNTFSFEFTVFLNFFEISCGLVKRDFVLQNTRFSGYSF